MTEKPGVPIIIDNGSETIKSGFSGEIKPKFLTPTVCGRIKSQFFQEGKNDIFFGKEALDNIEIVDINHPIEHGIIKNWDFIERVWYNVFDNVMNISTEKHPVILTDSPFNNESSRATMSEIIFETFNVPYLYIYNQSLLSLFANNISTGIVVDLGYGKSSFVGFENGEQLNTKHSLNIFGNDFNNLLIKLIGYYHGKTNFESEYANQIKELCFVSNNLEEDKNLALQKKLDKVFKLPDGNEVIIGRERFECPELLFQPSILGLEDKGIHELVFDLISQVKVENQPKFYTNIILCGGSSMFPGLDKRLKKEVEILGKIDYVDVHAPSNRMFSPWIGGSMLSSLSSFKKSWISPLQYNEIGTDAYLHKINL